MKDGNRPYSITYRIAYALSITHHSYLFLRKEYIEIPRIFKEFVKVMTQDPIRIPNIRQSILHLILIQDQKFAQKNLEFSLKKQGKPYPL